MPYVRQVFVSASEERLEKLIARRLRPGADREEIDARIWDLFGETRAVMFTDLAGFSRGVAEFGIIHFLQVIHESQRLLVPCVDEHDGILLKSDGDSMLIVFNAPAKAIECAVEMQRVLDGYNGGREEAERILLGVGIGYGRVLRIGDTDVFGAQVNAASKLGEDVAKGGEILVTAAVAEAVGGAAGIALEPIAAVPPGDRGAFRVLGAPAAPRP